MPMQMLRIEKNGAESMASFPDLPTADTTGSGTFYPLHCCRCAVNP
jgi:hypothetical protein